MIAQDKPSVPAHLDEGPIVIIDVHVLPRECLARVLGHDRNVPAECFATLDGWLGSGELTHPSLVVLCQYGCSDADSLKEVGRLAALGPHCPVVILSDNEDPDLIVRMLGKSVRGYVPTSLSIAVAIQAIELVRAGGVYVPAEQPHH
jgi:DNA-binding NarL/FixJ family response regulator